MGKQAEEARKKGYKTMSTENQTETETEKKPVGRPRKISDKQLALAREKYEAGWPIAKIARQAWCLVKPAALYYHLSGKSPKGDGAVDMRPAGRKGLSLEQLSFLVGQYQEGQTLTAIREMREMRKPGGKMFALPTLSKALKEAGVEVRRGRPPVEAEEEESEEASAE